MDLFHEVAEEQLSQGCRVSTPLFRAGLSLQGEFESMTGRIDTSKHTLRLRIQPAKGLTKKITKDIRLHRARDRRPTFALNYVKNLSSPDITGKAKINDVVELNGKGLKVYHCDAVYAVEYYTGAKPVAVSPVLRITATRAITTIPETLKPGEYKVCFVKKFNDTEYRTNTEALTIVKK